jgi:2-polyprenyl-3-methyl-5-hydroxy-6-metoxy-1,4-benzoquinol methylase
MEDYRFDGEIHWRPQHSFSYSDPDEAEQFLEAAIRSATDRTTGSEELAARIHDWVSYYHLTPKRCDLLRPLERFLVGDVLEVGCGCGAITGFLAQHARSVTAVEGSARRARITACRCEGMGNVSVYCDNFQNFTCQRRFDVVTSIGVIEDANGFFPSGGFDAMLRRLAEFVSDEGILLIAIENRLGLKYFAGAPEDHTGRPFESVQDLYSPHSALTLGRSEWSRKLQALGMEVCAWLYPWPDYKAPEIIISDAAFRQSGLDISSRIARCAYGFQDQPAKRCFSESLVWPVVVRNGLSEDLANSFFIVARRRGANHVFDLDALIWGFQTGRRRAYALETRIANKDGSLYIHRRRLYPEIPPSPALQPIFHASEPLPDEPRYQDELYAILNTPGWSIARLADWARPWLALLRSHGPDRLPATLLEYVPRRLVRRPGGALEAVGMEFASAEPLPIEFAVFRGLCDALVDARSAAEPSGGVPVAAADVAFAVITQLGMDSSVAMLEDCLTREAGLRHELSGAPADECRRSLREMSLQIRRPATWLSREGFAAQVFWRLPAAQFSEASSQKAQGRLGPGRQVIAISIPPLSPRPAEVRLDLADHSGVVRLYRLLLTTQDGRDLWAWDGRAESLQAAPRSDVKFVGDLGAVTAEMYSDDPILILPTPERGLAALEHGAVLRIEMEWVDALQYLRQIRCGT